MDNSTQNIQKGRALAGFGKVFSGIGVVILVAGVILSATPAIAAGVIIAVIGGVMGASGGKKLQGAAQGGLAQDALRAVFQEAEYLPRQHISQETLQDSGLPLPQAERMSGSGLVRARYHGRPLEISNLELLDLQPYQDPATQNWENNEVPVFHGRWMAAQLGRTLPCDLQAAPKGKLARLLGRDGFPRKIRNLTSGSAFNAAILLRRRLCCPPRSWTSCCTWARCISASRPTDGYSRLSRRTSRCLTPERAGRIR